MKQNLYELLYLYRSGQPEILEELMKELNPGQRSTVNAIICRYPPLSIYRQDLYQEANLALLNAIECYREDCGCSFSTFVNMVTRRRVWTVLRHYCAESYVQAHDTLDIEGTLHCSGGSDPLECHDKMGDPVYHLHYQLAAERLHQACEDLSVREHQILDAWTRGLSYRQASEAVGCSYKAYDGGLQRVREKIRRAVQDGGPSRS
jgi:RNA polymerase sporulation-specific sigma factor